MILMVIDHASMAYNGEHTLVARDSAATYQPGVTLDLVAFLTRWVTHVCAPTFVFLAGTALALSIERRAARGEDPWTIDKGILKRGAFIALLDPTLISLVSWRLTLQVLYAIGVSMMCMAALRRLSSAWLVGLALGWIVFGELAAGMVWDPAVGSPPLLAALLAVVDFQPHFRISYPLLPWLSMMVLGWVFGRYMTRYLGGEPVRFEPKTVLFAAGVASLVVFAALRWADGYGNMFLLRQGETLIEWLRVSKYPPSFAFTALELGLLCLCLATLMTIEPVIGVRVNGPLLVFGQTAMFYYLVHRVVLEGSAQWLGLRGVGGLTETYATTAVLLLALYPACLWYRGFKQRHPGGWTTYI